MKPQRKPKHHRSHALLLLIVLGVFFLLLSNSFKSSSGLITELNNFGHIVLFGSFAIGLLMWIRATQQESIRSNGMQYLLTFIVAIAIATFIEFLQVFGQRSADLADALRNAIGVSVFLGCYALFDDRIKRLRELNRGIKAVCLLVLLIFPALALVPVAKAMHFEYIKFSQLPVLLDFDEDWEYDLVLRSGAHIYPIRRGTHAGWARAQFAPNRFASLLFKRFWPYWGTYSKLHIELESEAAQPENFSVLVFDQDYRYEWEDGYKHDTVLQPGANTVTLDLRYVELGPQGRELQLNNIEAIELIRDNEARQLSIRIKRIVFE